MPPADNAIEIEGVRVTHPDRMLFPSPGLTKRGLVDHYLSIADDMLPHVADRPLSLVRCPQGLSGECFYQKHAGEGFPEAFHRVEIGEKSGTGEYLYIRDRAGLVAAVQMNVLEIHVWAAKRDRLENPDRLVFDLDPDEGLDLGMVREAAKEVRQRLRDVGLESFPLVTGGKGVHVVAPLSRRHGWQEHRDFSDRLAHSMASDDPDRYTATMSKQKREGRVFVDYLRNDRGNSAIAPFSTRARKGAPVAFPVSWRVLRRLETAQSVQAGEAAARLGRYRSNPWEGYFYLRQSLP